MLGLLLAPVTLPLSGFRFVLNQIAQMAERELLDEDRIREDLLLLQVQLDDGEITEDEYLAREADVIARLRLAREFRERRARGG
jgi:hypothetical protein